MRTPGSGRKPGTPNRSTREMRELTQQYGPRALERLVAMMEETTNEELRLECIKEILDRGYGKPSRAIELQVSSGSGIDYEAMSNEELEQRAVALLVSLRATREPLQIAARTDVEEGCEIVDGGVVVPDAEPCGLAPVGAEPKEPVTE